MDKVKAYSVKLHMVFLGKASAEVDWQCRGRNLLGKGHKFI